MKKGWQTKTLGDVCHVYQPETISQKQMIAGEFRVYGANGQIGWHNQFNHEEPELILGCRGSCGTVHVTEPRSWINGNAMVVHPTNGAMDISFLAYALKGGIELTDAITGAAQPQITRTSLMPLVISFPESLAEQQRIVGLLDEAFEGLATAKANAEKNLQNARALFESHLQSVFTQRGAGWVEKTLENCCEQIFAGGDVPKDRLSDERTPKFGVPIYSNGEKNDGLYGFTDVARVTKPSITVSARGTLGFTAIRTEPFLPVVRLIVLVPDQTQITLSFLYYAVVGMDFGNTGTSIPQLTVPNFKESKLHVPSPPEQEAIAEKLDALTEETQRLARLYERKLAALEALKKSLLHQAFTGAL